MEDEKDFSIPRSNKKRKMCLSLPTDQNSASLDELPDDLVLKILSKLGSTASCPADFISLLLTCKRMKKLGLDRTVLSKVSPEAFTCIATNWGEHNPPEFLYKCVRAGNVEAMYSLGIISFYLYDDTRLGKSLIARAASNRHPHALYAMSVILFTGSSPHVNIERGRRLKLAFNFALRAAFLGNVDALRELGYRMQNGEQVPKDPDEGRCFLLQASAWEVLSMMPLTAASRTEPEERIPLPIPTTPITGSGSWVSWVPRGPRLSEPVSVSDLRAESDFGWDVPAPVPHPANRCVAEYYELFGIAAISGTGLCSCKGCCRTETRIGEFFECPCLENLYCSRACQAKDMKWRHRQDCIGWETDEDNDDEDNEENVALGGGGIQEEEEEGELQSE